MARIRSIHPDACDSEKLAEVSADAERLFWRLQTHCDDYGRCEDHPRLIWARCLPLVDGWSAKKVDAAMAELHDVGLLTRYKVEGEGFVQIDQWDRFQHPQRKGKDNLPDLSMADHELVAEPSRTSRVLVSSGEEGSGEGEGAEREPSMALAVVTAPAPTFDDFWSAYPRKVGKLGCQKVWERVTRKTDPGMILSALHAQLPKMLSDEERFRPHPQTWLNEGRWEDAITQAPVFGKNDSVLQRLAGGEL